mmetsp:Transcript_18763/g.45097  ORF Transcript_18763/g.45097 Transcript_18763/m.45097 type:complete len:326 (+) Transcript_18763:712-1689(+)
MLQTLVVRRPEEDEGAERAAGVSVVEALVAVALVAAHVQHVRHVLDVDVVEGSGVALVACQTPHLAEQRLDEMADRHARGDSVRVHDQVRRDPLAREGHVVLAIGDAHRALLSVARGKLVADLRHSHRTHLDLNEARATLRRSEHDLVDCAMLVVAQPRARVALGGLRRLVVLVLGLHERGLADDDVAVSDILAGVGEAVDVELVIVDAGARAAELLLHRALERLGHEPTLALRLVRVAPVEHRPEQPSVDRRLVHYQRILLVVPGVDSNGHDKVLACRQLAELEVVHGVRFDQGLLGVVEHVRQRVDADLEVGGVDAHGLLAHR